MSENTEIAVHPVQVPRGYPRECAVCPQVITMRAYEVYCHFTDRQEALVTGGCRGGFGVGELISFLYAYPFPKNEWKARVDEAFRGMKLS